MWQRGLQPDIHPNKHHRTTTPRGNKNASSSLSSSIPAASSHESTTQLRNSAVSQRRPTSQKGKGHERGKGRGRERGRTGAKGYHHSTATVINESPSLRSKQIRSTPAPWAGISTTPGGSAASRATVLDQERGKVQFHDKVPLSTKIDARSNSALMNGNGTGSVQKLVRRGWQNTHNQGRVAGQRVDSHSSHDSKSRSVSYGNRVQLTWATQVVKSGPKGSATSTKTLNEVIAQHRREKNEQRHKAFVQRSAMNNKRAKKVTVKGLSSSGAQEQSSLFDWVKPAPKKMTASERRKAKQKVSSKVNGSGLGGNGLGPRKQKKVVVITPAQLEIAQKVARGEELTEEEIQVKQLVQNKAKKKRKKRPTRLKRIIMNERKERWIAEHGEEPIQSLQASVNNDNDPQNQTDSKANGNEGNHEAKGGDVEYKVGSDNTVVREKKDTVSESTDPDELQEKGQTSTSPPTSEGDESTILVESEGTLSAKAAAPADVSDSVVSALAVVSDSVVSAKKNPFKYPKVANKNRVREYVTQNLDIELDQIVSSMLRTLFKFQEKARLVDPLKAKQSRRIVLGLREVFRGVRTKRAKAVIVATDIEESPTDGGLDSRVRGIIGMAEEHDIPVIYSLTRRRLGKALKKVKTSCIAIQSGDGAWEELKKAIKTAAALADEWRIGIRRPDPYEVASGKGKAKANEKKRNKKGGNTSVKTAEAPPAPSSFKLSATAGEWVPPSLIGSNS